jgi:hypothetical protein
MEKTAKLRDFLILDDGSLIRKTTVNLIHIDLVPGNIDFFKLLLEGSHSFAVSYRTWEGAQRGLARLTDQLAEEPEKEENKDGNN